MMSSVDGDAASRRDVVDVRTAEARWVDAETVAAHLSVDRSSVYEHAAELGDAPARTRAPSASANLGW
jgi:hypothetical protein